MSQCHLIPPLNNVMAEQSLFRKSVEYYIGDGRSLTLDECPFEDIDLFHLSMLRS